MHRASSRVEGARVDEREAAAARRDHGEFREADVVADGDGDLAVRRQVDDCDVVAGREHFRLFEGDLARDVDVEEMYFAVRGKQGAGGREGEGGIVVLLGRGVELWDAAAD